MTKSKPTIEYSISKVTIDCGFTWTWSAGALVNKQLIQ